MREQRIEPAKIVVDETVSSRLVPRTELDQDLVDLRPETVQTNASVSRRYPFFESEEDERFYEEVHRLFHESRARETYELCGRGLESHPYNMLLREHQALAMSIMPTTDHSARLEACIAHAKETLAMNRDLRSGAVAGNLVPAFKGGLRPENHDHIDGVTSYNLAEWSAELGRFDEAARYAEEAFLSLPDPVSRIFACALLCKILRAVGRDGEALSAEERGKRIDESIFSEVQQRLASLPMGQSRG
jgi:tetratricopeptide (TPR) repeat protein